MSIGSTPHPGCQSQEGLGWRFLTKKCNVILRGDRNPGVYIRSIYHLQNMKHVLLVGGFNPFEKY